MQHRRINRDGYAECFACGTVVEFTAGGDTEATFDAIPCHPGGWMHPPYAYGLPEADWGFKPTLPDYPVVETCAAHPYADCHDDALAVVRGEGVPA